MGQALYYIVHHDGRWKVRHSGAEYPYQSRPTALSAAIDAAHTSGARGHEAQVLVQDEGGRWCTEWRYDRDPYPPAT
ncbi:hypothetical protein BH11PSE6_BH11PSE6_25890 [soil metagenome]